MMLVSDRTSCEREREVLPQDWQICDPLLNVVVKEVGVSLLERLSWILSRNVFLWQARLLGGAVAIALTMLVCCSVVMFYVEAPSNPKFGTLARAGQRG